MTLLVAGLVLFIALHLVPSVAPLRAGLVAGMGEKPYRGVFSALAFAGLAMIVWGYAAAPFEPVYSPPDWGRQAAMWVVPAALV
ncbi:MAG: NnrU family protein, partial [Alphaproteobacteria bacterium]|nr:NnrU family protein [Alphaproteobacteria bacterium]